MHYRRWLAQSGDSTFPVPVEGLNRVTPAAGRRRRGWRGNRRRHGRDHAPGCGNDPRGCLLLTGCSPQPSPPRVRDPGEPVAEPSAPITPAPRQRTTLHRAGLSVRRRLAACPGAGRRRGNPVPVGRLDGDAVRRDRRRPRRCRGLPRLRRRADRGTVRRASARPPPRAGSPLDPWAWSRSGRSIDRPASWSSPDGLSWTARRDAFPATVTGTDVIQVTGVVSTADGWLAVGREDPSLQPQLRPRAGPIVGLDVRPTGSTGPASRSSDRWSARA